MFLPFERKHAPEENWTTFQPACITDYCLYKPPITTLSVLLWPVLGGAEVTEAATVGNKTDNKPKTNQSTLPRIADANLTALATSENLQPNSGTSSTRDSDYRSVLAERSQPRRTCQSRHTQLFFV